MHSFCLYPPHVQRACGLPPHPMPSTHVHSLPLFPRCPVRISFPTPMPNTHARSPTRCSMRMRSPPLPMPSTHACSPSTRCPLRLRSSAPTPYPPHPLLSGYKVLTCSPGCLGPTSGGCSLVASHRQTWHPGRHSAESPESSSVDPKQKVIGFLWEKLDLPEPGKAFKKQNGVSPLHRRSLHVTPARSARMVAVGDHPPHRNCQRRQTAAGRARAWGHPPANPSPGETRHGNHAAPHPGSLSRDSEDSQLVQP